MRRTLLILFMALVMINGAFAATNIVVDKSANTGSAAGIANSGANDGGSSTEFDTPAGYAITVVNASFSLIEHVGSPTKDYVADLYQDSAGKPGTKIATSNRFDPSVLTGSYALYNFSFNETPLSASTTYHLAIRVFDDSFDGSNFGRWQGKTVTGKAWNENDGSTWSTIDANFQFAFQIWNGSVSAPPTSNATLKARNRYNTSFINTFNAYVNGTNYSTTNGTIVLPIPSTYPELWNITYSSAENGGYFGQTYTDINLTTEHTGQLYQARVSWNATNRVSGEQVRTFSMNTTYNQGSNNAVGTNPVLNLSNADNFKAQFHKQDYYSVVSDFFNVTQLQTTNQNVAVYNHVLNLSITVSDGLVTSQNFSANVYSQDYSFNERMSTTNGSIRFNLTNGTYTIWINDSIHQLKEKNFTLNSSANWTNLNINLQTSNLFNLTFFNETSNQLINQTVYYDLISTSTARNGSTSNGTAIETLLTPDTYEIRYWREADVPRTYYVTLSNQSSEQIRLYLVDDAVSETYQVIVQDGSNARCANETVSLLRYYIDINGYRTVSMSKTNTLGEAVFFIVPVSQPYKFSFTGSCGSFVSDPTVIVNTQDTYVVTQAQSYLASFEGIDNVVYNITYNNATSTYVFTWVDGGNLVSQGCMEVTKLFRGIRTTEYTSCTSSSSGSLIYTINNTNETTYFAQGRLVTNTEFSNYYTEIYEVNNRTTFQILGSIGLFMAALLIIALILFAGSSAVTVSIGAVGGLAMAVYSGIIFTAWTTVVGLIILAVIIASKARSI